MGDADELVRRVARLDAELGNSGSGGTVPAMMAFTRVLGLVNEEIPGPARSPALADSIVGGSRLLGTLRAGAPEVTDGPLARQAQLWISTGKPAHVPAGHPVPVADRFAAAGTTRVPPGTKPFGLGLFTSTGITGTFGMWWAYLRDNGGGPGGLFPYPWRVWAIEPARRSTVYEVTGAARWAELVAGHPARHDGLVYPDWPAIAGRYDGVHMTARAVAATQGLRLCSPAGDVAAPFWGVESTLWLRWCFRPPRLVHSVG